MKDLLYVFYEKELVGELSRDRELSYTFSYDDAWASDPNHFSLSLAMPLAQKTYGNKTTLSFFENLLPEGEVRTDLERSQGVKGTFSFLQHYGKDCAGAITLTPDKDYAHSIDNSQMSEVPMDQIYRAISKGDSVTDVIAEIDPGYLSLAGAQDKFPAIYKDGKFYFPLKGAPTTHIIKTPITRQGIKESVYNEYFCMELARAVGLKVSECFLYPGDHHLFVTKRYDRFADKENKVHRIHQQDFCQAQGITSEFKYESKGGPGIKEDYDLIFNHVPIANRLATIHSFLDWLCFNLLIGNNDSHSKNISFLLKNNRSELAPFYDLICTSVYPRLKNEFSFKFGGRDHFSHIGKNEFEAVEKELSIKKSTLLERLKNVHKRVTEEKGGVAGKILGDFPGVKIIPRICDLIDDRAKSLKFQKAL